MTDNKAQATLARLLPQQEDSKEYLLFALDHMIWPLLLITFVVFSLFVPIFSSSGNIEALLYGSAALGAIVLAETICLLSGHFDLSVGSIAGFSAVFTGVFLTQWFPATPGPVAILAILVVGGVVGLLNGVSVAYIGVNPFLQTLAFLMIFRGSVTMLSTSAMVDLPGLYTFVGGGQIFGVLPFAVVLMVLLFAAVGLWLKYSTMGRSIYAVGSDKNAAAEAGIDVKQVILFVYIASGVLSALGGLLFTGYIGAAAPTIGNNTVFPAFAAAIIGGVGLFGGRGNVIGAAGGVLLLATIETGLVLLNIDPTVVNVVNGIILLFAIILYTMEEKFREQVLTA
jgi:ribose/xylose/arabinose/galactoside ABC-type transport system permease subunit